MPWRKLVSWILRTLFGHRKAFSLGLYGSPNVGKCLGEGEKVLLANGLYENIEDIFWRVARFKNKVPSQYEECIECSDLNIFVPSLNKDTLRIEKKRVTHVYRQRYKNKMYKIQTRLGRQVTVSPEHPFISLTPKGVIAESAKSLCRGSKIALLSNYLPTIEGNALSDAVNNPCQQFMETSDGRITLQMRFHKPMPVTPQKELTPDIARFIAYPVSESQHTDKHIGFPNENQEMLSDFKQLSNSFGIDPIYYCYENKTPLLRINNKVLIEFLRQEFGLQPSVSKDKRIPKKILSADDALVTQFLRTIYDCEGDVSGGFKQHKSINFTSASKELVVGVQILLLRFGIVGLIRKKIVGGKPYYVLEIRRSKNHRLFRDKIGFQTLRKSIALNNICVHESKSNAGMLPVVPLLEEIRHSVGASEKTFYLCHKHVARMRRTNRITVEWLRKMVCSNNLFASPQTAFVKNLAFSDVEWDDVTKIEELDYDGYIYDLTVEDNHTFVTWDGLVVHNTTLANRISMDWTGEPVGKVSEIPHETRAVQKKERIELTVDGRKLTMNLLDMPGIATKVDYRSFIPYGLKPAEAQQRAKEATKGVIEAIKWLEHVDAALVVMDACEDPYTQVNLTILGNLEARNIPVILVANKIDKKNAKPELIKAAFPQHHVIEISALKGDNINHLYRAIAKCVK